MRVTVLGKSPAWQDAGGACSCYLVEEGETALVLDCGSGAFAKLRERFDYARVDAVVISHMHADHFLDLVPFAYGLTLSPRAAGDGTLPARAAPRLVVPRGGRDVLRHLTELWGNADLVEDAFALEEYGTAEPVEVGPLAVRFCEVPHHVDTHAVEIRSGVAGPRLTFSGDCRPNEALVEFAGGTDLLLIEATLGSGVAEPESGHLTAAQAGEHARRAGARRAVLTHISDELDLEGAQAEAAEVFGGPLEVARAGAVYELEYAG